MVMKSKHLILAGTFDHLHKGHQQFIKTAVSKADFVSCGVADNWSKKNKLFPQTIQSFDKRVKSLKQFLVKNSVLKKTGIFPLKDPFQPAISNQSMDMIAVTPDTFSGAQLINQKRKLNHLNPLKILQIDLIKANDHNKISSTRIRSGEINRQGLVYQQIFKKGLYLPQNQRRHFKKPLGKLILGSRENISWAGMQAFDQLNHKKNHLIITVGDITTQAFLLNNLPLDLAIFDHRCQRQNISKNLHLKLKNKADFYYQVKNSPGMLSQQTLQTVQKSLPQLKNSFRGVIEVQGEEDLLVLPVVLLAPLKSLIFYGQPNKGLVRVKVTEKVKSKVLELLKKFIS